MPPPDSIDRLLGQSADDPSFWLDDRGREAMDGQSWPGPCGRVKRPVTIPLAACLATSSGLLPAAVLPRVRHHEGPAENRRSDAPHPALARPTVGRRQTVSATRWYQYFVRSVRRTVRTSSTTFKAGPAGGRLGGRPRGSTPPSDAQLMPSHQPPRAPGGIALQRFSKPLKKPRQRSLVNDRG